ncbi:MCE family protein [Micromonospora krabiensis]|uniref:Phospholipid/cholesterol/gamma-HCH transport system substrate-binding protein n=1 Tax=Micromonospora krabiensis TaxID=307121 RepID=A0A1C3N2V0_9ACTN|nr:MCE family protein [Micromonospora krabiensis]SBV26897.1 phospholipid/cholesterol/gamma-HCH transport system substrate-binding protein [Micromonospora krabiensis]
MRPFRERNPAAVGAVGLAVIVATLLGAFQLDRLAALTGRSYEAAFSDASGLATGNEVRVVGVRVGAVTAVELARGPQPYVRVRFRVDDDGVRLGRDTGATIRIKTVLGQKYLALAPAGPDRLPEGARIPLDRTAAPFDVVQAVTGLADTLDHVDTDQLADAFRTLSETFADTPGSVNSSLVGLSRLSRTVAERDAELRSLLDRARQVTDVLATRDEEFRKLVADGEALLAEVSRRRDAIHRLLVGTDELATELSGLVADNRAQLEPALHKLRDVVAVLQRNRDELEQTVRRMAPFVTAFANVVGNGRWFDSYVSGLLQPYVPTGGR